MYSYHNQPLSKVLYGLFLILSLSFFIDAAPACAQEQPNQFFKPQPVKRSVLRRERRDSLANTPRFGRAALLLGVAEMVPFIVNRSIRKVDFANISWESTKYNVNPGHWAWDNDPFQTNQFAHPYHGSIFFNSFRSNGYSFWQSGAATVAGSYLWETFAEKQAPAPNDLINTSFGGIVLGEMTHRLSNKIINNKARGFKRQASEVVAMIINPANGLNRILDGRWGRVSNNTLEADSSKVSAMFDLGYRAFNNDLKGTGTTRHAGWYASARLIYGTPYENFRKPFSNITIAAELGKDDSTSLNVVSVYGSLTGWQLDTAQSIKHLLILSANYDYLHNVAFFYGAQSVKFNLYSKFNVSKKIKLSTTVGAGGILLAAVPDKYLNSNGRNYDYGPGLSYNIGGRLSLMDKLFLGVNYRGGWIRTLNGNASNYVIHAATGEVSYMIVEGVSVAAEPGYFTLRGHYKVLPDVINNYPFLRASVRYTVNLK